MAPKVVVGLMGSSVAKGAGSLQTTEGIKSFLSVCKRHDVKELDTARVYAGGRSEEMAGSVGACKDFAVSTKAPAFAPKSLSYEKIVDNCEKSLKALQTEKVDIYYLHGPDRLTSLEDQCRAMGDLYKKRCFERWGVSNISDKEVKEIHEICQKEGYPLPKVYQGGFNPIGRGPEATLIPLLRELDMNFYAFSPLGGGLLAKPIDELMKPKKGTRFDEMKVFGDIYLTEEITEGLRNVQKACDEEGVLLMEATMRWFMHHSVLNEGDGVILGASSDAQIDASLSACEKGPLSETLQKAWEDLWSGLQQKGKVPKYHS